jgi:hypothetical protein
LIGTKGQEPGFVHIDLSFCGLAIIRQVDHGGGRLDYNIKQP